MSSDMKKYVVLGSMLLTVILLSSCVWKSEENKIVNNTNKVNLIEKNQMMDDMWEHSMDMDNMKWEWTDEEMAAMEGMEWMDNMEHWMMNMNGIEWIDLYNYILYSEEKIKESKKLKVLFFNDNNLESIKTLKLNLQESKIHDGLVMYQIDFNEDKELKNKYEIISAHTFVQVDENLNVIRKWEWSKTIDEMHTALTSPMTIVKVEEKTMMKSEWVYKDYSSESLSSAKWNIVLFFAASWCPSCKTADKNLSAEAIPEGLTILKLDYDSNLELRKKYSITSQHAFVQVDNEGNEIEKWYGTRDVEGILKKIK